MEANIEGLGPCRCGWGEDGVLGKGGARRRPTHLSQQLQDAYVFPGHDVAAAGGSVVRAGVLVNAPVARPLAPHAAAAGVVAATVVEGKVSGDEVLVGLAGADGERHKHVVMVGGDGRAVLRRGRGARQPRGGHQPVRRGRRPPHTLVLGAGGQLRQGADSQLNLWGEGGLSVTTIMSCLLPRFVA